MEISENGKFKSFILEIKVFAKGTRGSRNENSRIRSLSVISNIRTVLIKYASEKFYKFARRKGGPRESMNFEY